MHRLQEYNFTSEDGQVENTIIPMPYCDDRAKGSALTATKSRRE
jgi:hypothetical protein